MISQNTSGALGVVLPRKRTTPLRPADESEANSRPWAVFTEKAPRAAVGKPTLISLFAGCGGFDLGFRQAGFKTIWANDISLTAAQTYEANLGSIVVGDIRKTELPDLSPTVLTAGFPCQSFSNAGSRKGTGDPRGTLFKEALKAAKHFRPKVLIFENVRGLMTVTHEGELLIETICRQLNDIGYAVRFRLINTLDHRVPQKRIRLLLVGVRKDLKLNFTFPGTASRSGLTLGETIMDVPQDAPNMEHIIRVNPQARYILSMVPEGGSWVDIPYAKLPDRLKKIRDNITFYKHPCFYRRFHRDEVCGTVTASFKAENAGIWHPSEDRPMTAREAARIQTFPDWFAFKGDSPKEIYQQIGNAVPPRMAYELATHLLKILRKQQVGDGETMLTMKEFLEMKRPLRPTDPGVQSL